MGRLNSYFILVLLILNKFSCYLLVTPLCNLCPCNSKPNEPPQVNCKIDISKIYDRKFWYKNNNDSFPIDSLTIKSKNLEKLKTPFPLSILKLLDLSNNEIEDLGIGVFSQLQKMETLILANNNIKQINPDSFRGVYTKNEYFPLRSLKQLNLRNNKITTLDPDVFEHIDELEELILGENPLRVIDSPTITATASLVYLQILDLSQTEIKELPNTFIFALKKLKYLDLSGNNFTRIPSTLNESYTLETLLLSNNSFEKLSDDNVFPNIECLKILHLSGMSYLRVIGSRALSGLKNLKELHICHNAHLRYIHPHAMISVNGTKEMMPPLEKVFLSNNNLSYIDKELLLDFKNFKHLDISSNPFTCGCRNQWIIDDLIPYYEKSKTVVESKKLICSHPEELKGLSLFTLYQRKASMRCLDIYGNEEHNSFWLIATISGILTGVLITMLIVYAFRAKTVNDQFMYSSLQNIKSSRV